MKKLLICIMLAAVFSAGINVFGAHWSDALTDSERIDYWDFNTDTDAATFNWQDDDHWDAAGAPGGDQTGALVSIDFFEHSGGACNINMGDLQLTLGHLSARIFTHMSVHLGPDRAGSLLTFDTGDGSESLLALFRADATQLGVNRSRIHTDIAMNNDLRMVTASSGVEHGIAGGHISGDYHLTIEHLSRNANDPDSRMHLGYYGPNSYTGGTTLSAWRDSYATGHTGARVQFVIVSEGAFGTGDVWIDGDGEELMIVFLDADEVMADNAELFISEPGRVEIELAAGTNTTLADVSVIDGNNVGLEGTWTAEALNTMLGINSFSGEGTLTVTGVEEGYAFPSVAGYVRMTLESEDWQLVGLPFNQISDEMVALADVLGTIGFVNGTEVMAWDGTGYVASSFFLGTWSGNIELRRGQGFWIKSPVDVDLYLLGQVPGEADTAIELPRGLQLISSPYPAAIDLNDEDILLSVPFNGDQIFFLGEEAGYTSNSYFMGTWSGAGMLEPGKGYWYDSVGEQEMLIGIPY